MSIFGTIHNCGDGSARACFFTTKALAEWDDRQEEESGEHFSEPTVFEIKGVKPPPAGLENDVENPLSYWVKKRWDDRMDEEKIQEYLKTFFPKGLPKLEVRAEEAIPGYNYLIVSSKGKDIAKVFAKKDVTPEQAVLKLKVRRKGSRGQK